MTGRHELAVDVDDVSKRFRLYREKYTSLKERVLHAGRNPHEDFWALRDVNFGVSEAETVGVVGRNGSGKSTLLKCISGVLQPTNGQVVVRGQLAALLELGAGFQPELSGRENVFLNAALLGLSAREIERRFDEIVAFAELEQFIDNQVKYYSSGMYVRLGFAVAVNVDPDVLVIDEVLAVGDENFQRKCLARIQDFQNEGRTIIFVTHSSDLVKQICDRAVVIESGRVICIADAAEAIRFYHDHLVSLGTAEHIPGELDEVADLGARRIRISGVNVQHPGMGHRPYMLPGEPLEIAVLYDAIEHVEDVVFTVSITDQAGTLIFSSDTKDLQEGAAVPTGSGRVDFTFDSVPLLDGIYEISTGICTDHGVVIDLREQAAQFEVMNPGRSRGTVALNVRAEIQPAVSG